MFIIDVKEIHQIFKYFNSITSWYENSQIFVQMGIIVYDFH